MKFGLYSWNFTLEKLSLLVALLLNRTDSLLKSSVLIFASGNENKGSFGMCSGSSEHSRCFAAGSDAFSYFSTAALTVHKYFNTAPFQDKYCVSHLKGMSADVPRRCYKSQTGCSHTVFRVGKQQLWSQLLICLYRHQWRESDAFRSLEEENVRKKKCKCLFQRCWTQTFFARVLSFTDTGLVVFVCWSLRQKQADCSYVKS